MSTARGGEHTPASRVVVVGGGTAGWLAALHVSTGLALLGVEPEVTVIESGAIPTIGVGEATLPSLGATLEFIGCDEAEFLAAVGGTHKHSIRFDRWCTGGPSDTFHHPFGPLASVADAGVAPVERAGGIGATDVYGFHLDARRFADHLRTKALQRAVRHMVAEVVDVVLGPHGIEHVTTTDGRSHTADLFIDATGFARALISHLEPGWVSYRRELPCDRALTARQPGRAVPRDHTTATAHRAGWLWEIDLQHTTGVSLVYASAFMSDDEAGRTFVEMVDHTDETRLIEFEPGRLDRPWVKNCVAVGLAGGFVEPLESTGLFLVEDALSALASRWPTTAVAGSTIDRFNQHVAARYDEIRDFLVAHYCLSERDEPFWRHARETLTGSETLRHNLDRWRERVPVETDLADWSRFISRESWTHIVAGMGWLKS